MQGTVPLMAIIWVLTSLVICVMNIGQLPHVIVLFSRVLLAGRKRQAARRDIP
ncbi:alanine:cation symporter family protein [Shigella flexneri]